MNNINIQPLAFDASFEVEEEGERKTIAELAETLNKFAPRSSPSTPAINARESARDRRGAAVRRRSCRR